MAENPRHIAIIMDGNGRWAMEKNQSRMSGHRAGMESIREIVNVCGEMGVQYLTLYAFSRENWQRPAEEVHFLMDLLALYLDQELKGLQKNNVRLRTIGYLKDLPTPVQEKIQKNIETTKNNSGLCLNLALSYSSREEITDACREIATLVQKKEIAISDIDSEMIADHLYTKGMPDPDLLIRTSGEMRISNFLLWQISYAEIYITEKFWPDFKKEDLLAAVEEYKKRDRRYGRTEAAKHGA